jgi:hypothetical protein
MVVSVISDIDFCSSQYDSILVSLTLPCSTETDIVALWAVAFHLVFAWSVCVCVCIHLYTDIEVHTY